LALITVGAEPARAVSVDCDTPDDFCTGDPCQTVGAIDVTVPSCLLDFTPRALVLGTVRLPNDGTLTIQAGSIELRGRIAGKHTSSLAGDGANVTLIASGPISLTGRIDTSGRTSVGSIQVGAGGDLLIAQNLRARVRGRGATATGGTVTLTTSGTFTATPRGRIDVRGRRRTTAGGTVSLSSQGDALIQGRIDARGAAGGSVTLGSLGGSVSIEDEIRAQADAGDGGDVVIVGATDVSFASSVADVLAVGAGSAGGTIALVAGNDAVIPSHLDASATGGPGGTIGIAALGDLTANRLRANTKLGPMAGAVSATAASIFVVRAQARGDNGGAVQLWSTSGDVSVTEIDVQGELAGGTATVMSSGNALIDDDVWADGLTGGTFVVSAAGNVTIGTGVGSNVDVDGSGGGGLVIGQAGGDLIAAADFSAQVSGCISLTAAGMLDISQSSFDVPLSPSCP
jgi:hypothetical protein